MLSALMLFVLLHNPTVIASNKTPGTILVLGDSLSGAWGIDTEDGWVALLQRQIQQEGYEYRVVNASVSGDTTRTGLGRIDTALDQHRPSIVILALGGNDGLRGLAFSEIESSLANIIQRCRQQGADVLLAGVRLPPNYGPVYNERFAAIFRSLSDRYDLPLVPRMLDQVAENPRMMQQDGIHPTAAAQPQIMKNVLAGLEPMLVRSGSRDE